MNDFEHTPIEVASLHPFDAEWACSKPERPWHENLHFDFRCRSCWLHAKATVLSGLDPIHGFQNYATRAVLWCPLSERVAAQSHLFEFATAHPTFGQIVPGSERNA